MQSVQKRIRLHRVQADFHHSRAPYRGFVGGIGSGKSWVGAYDLITRAKRGRTYMVVGPSYPSLSRSTMRTFLKLARELDVIDPDKIRTAPPPQMTLTTGAEILFASADRPDTLRGPNLTGIWLDEASLMTEEAYDIGIGRLREMGEHGFLTATFTPKGPSHWTHRVFGTGRVDTKMFRAPTRANPFNPPDFEARLRRQYGSTQFARQELEGEFVQLEGAEWSAPLVYLTDAKGENPRRWFTQWPSPEKIVARVIALDPSKGVSDYARKDGGRDSDYQAYAIVMMDQRGTFWVDIDANRESVQEMVTRGIALIREHGPLYQFVVEDNDGLGMLVTEFRRQLREQIVTVPIVPIRNTVNKIFRLRRLGGYLSNEHPEYGPQLRIKDTPGGRLLTGQMLDFPMGAHEDCVDCLEMALRPFESLVNG